jgi:hypothetical protein
VPQLEIALRALLKVDPDKRSKGGSKCCPAGPRSSLQREGTSSSGPEQTEGPPTLFPASYDEPSIKSRLGSPREPLRRVIFAYPVYRIEGPIL